MCEKQAKVRQRSGHSSEGVPTCCPASLAYTLVSASVAVPVVLMRSPPPACQPCQAHVCIFPVGRCGLSIYRLDQKAHLISSVVVHARVDQCRIALTDVDTTTLSESEAHKYQRVGGQFKRQAHPTSQISIHVDVGQRCRAFDGEPSANLCQTQQALRSSGGHWKLLLERAVAHISCRHVFVHADRLENCYASRGYEEATTPLCQE